MSEQTAGLICAGILLGFVLNAFYEWVLKGIEIWKLSSLVALRNYQPTSVINAFRAVADGRLSPEEAEEWLRLRRLRGVR